MLFTSKLLKKGYATNGTAIESKEGMYYVYILQSTKYQEKYYVGFTKDLGKRFEDHNNSKSVYTTKYKPWKIAYYCAFVNKKKALDFEKYLKTSSEIVFRNKRLI